jgi:hypothetical protein
MKKTKTVNSTLDIFVSHSSKNQNSLKLLLEILRLALNIPSKRIRCTSVHGHKLNGGVSQDDQLRNDILHSKVFICLITPASIKSFYVILEIGLRLANKQNIIPLIGSTKGASLLMGPLKNMHALNGCSKEEIFQLISQLAVQLDIEAELPSVYIDKVEELVKLFQMK